MTEKQGGPNASAIVRLCVHEIRLLCEHGSMFRPRSLRPVVLLSFPLAVATILVLGGCSKQEPTAASTVTLASESGASATTVAPPATTPGSTPGSTKGTVGTTPRAPGSTKAPRPPLTMPTLSGVFCEDLALVAAMREADRAEGSSGDSTDTSPEEYAILRAFFEDLRDSAPAEMQAPFTTIITTLSELNSLPSTGEASIGRAIELLFDPVFLQASKDINTYGRETCGLPSDALDGLDNSGSGSGGNNGGTSGGGFGDDNNDPGSNKKGIMDRLEAAYPGAPWIQAKNGHSLVTASDSADVTVTGEFDGGLGRIACDDILKFLRIEFADVEVKVTNDEGTITYAKAGKDTGGVCVLG